MSSVQALREFINERLTAAAGEIFTVFEQTIVQYEEEIDRQHKLLQIRWKPQPIINKAEFPREHVCEGGQPFNQEATLTLDQEESLPSQIKVGWEGTEIPHIKEEQEETEPPRTKKEPVEPESSQICEEMKDVCTSQEAELPVLKLESDSFMVTSTERSRFSAPETDDEQLLPHDSAVADIGTQEDGEQIDSGSTRCEELEPNRIYVRGDVEDSAVSQMFSQNQKQLSREASCGSLFGTRLFLDNSGTQTNVKQYTCEICGKTCSRKNNLLVHMRIHTGEKPYYCQTCGKSFKYQHYFLIHMRNHTGETPFTCNSCGKKFTNSSSLIKHRRIHSDKKHHCVTCGESFSQKSYLLTHMKLHTGEKPYSCETCGKSFSRRSNLVVHFRTHTGDQACYCAVCGRGFSSRSSLLVHVRHHTGEKPYSCETSSFAQ